MKEVESHDYRNRFGVSIVRESWSSNSIVRGFVLSVKTPYIQDLRPKSSISFLFFLWTSPLHELSTYTPRFNLLASHLSFKSSANGVISQNFPHNHNHNHNINVSTPNPIRVPSDRILDLECWLTCTCVNCRMPLPTPSGAAPAAHRVCCVRCLRACKKNAEHSCSFDNPASAKCAYCTKQKGKCIPVSLRYWSDMLVV